MAFGDVRRLFLMRHAEPAPFAPGGDIERPLTSHGLDQARQVGQHLAGRGIERVLASPATRARQTVEGLALPALITVVDSLYDGAPGRLHTQLTRLPEYLTTVLLVGHYPGIPGLVSDLADSQSDRLVRSIELQFSPATLVELEFSGPWTTLHAARVVSVFRPDRPPYA